MTTEEFKKAIEAFRKPLSSSEVEWRIRSAKGAKTTVVPYINNRAVMERLDECFGSEGWKNEFKELSSGKGFLCGISVEVQFQWRTKFDGAPFSDIEAVKGGLSDAMKRAAVQWGLGRELYSYPRVVLEGEHRFIPYKVKNRLDGLVTAFVDGKLDRDYYLIPAK